MQSQKATDDCRRRPIGLCAHAQIRDDGPNMETYHEGTYRSSRVGHADCGPDIRSPGERGSDVPGELFIPFEDEPGANVLELSREKLGYRTLVAREIESVPSLLRRRAGY